jgi:hypothetical protein
MKTAMPGISPAGGPFRPLLMLDSKALRRSHGHSRVSYWANRACMFSEIGLLELWRSTT